MNKKMFAISFVILALASGSGFADYTKKELPTPENTEEKPPLTQQPLTLPFNKLSNEIVHRYEARRKIIDDSKTSENEQERLQASKERFKKEKTYLLSGKF
ncbi:MAG: hypothetical protein GW748_02005 [Alphaproteobacteria bacterium]|nr:hypothetical protein [Alphaproteobacteria bacterium]NCQ66502.1 hypothetical protein [Alphaproteobacteria bacterium]NCT08293.1 hypothetical protein [Alphaproteobacteria bacterium]